MSRAEERSLIEFIKGNNERDIEEARANVFGKETRIFQAKKYCAEAKQQLTNFKQEAEQLSSDFEKLRSGEWSAGQLLSEINERNNT